MTSFVKTATMFALVTLCAVLMFAATNCEAKSVQLGLFQRSVGLQKDKAGEERLLNALFRALEEGQVDKRYTVATPSDVVRNNKYRKHGTANINCETMNGVIGEVKGCVDYVCEPAQQLTFIYETSGDIHECLDDIHSSLNNGWKLVGTVMKQISFTKAVATFADPIIKNILNAMNNGLEKVEKGLEKIKPGANLLDKLDEKCQAGKTRLCIANQVLGSLVTVDKSLPGLADNEITEAIEDGVGPVRDACTSKGFNQATQAGADIVKGLDKANTVCNKLKSPLKPLINILNKVDVVLGKKLCVKIKIIFKKKICASVKSILKGLSGNKWIKKAMKGLTKLAKKAMEPVIKLLKPAINAIKSLIPDVPDLSLTNLNIGSFPSLGNFNLLDLNTNFFVKINNFFNKFSIPSTCKNELLTAYYAAEFTPDKGDTLDEMDGTCFIST